MPTYDYVCDGCEHRFEQFQSITADPMKDCPECKEPRLRRLIGAGGALIFKGSGFYCTDYKKPANPGKPDEKALDAKVEKAKEASAAVKSEAKSSSTGSGSGGTTSAA